MLFIVGRSNTGKTTLLEKLIALLSQQGLTIATIKHSHHQPEMDTPGKDSWRHKQAGAVASLLVAPKSVLMVSDVDEACSPESLAARCFPQVDLVLVEGYAAMAGAKIEVLRAERADRLRHADNQGLIAVVSDIPTLECSVPIFALNDVVSLALFIQQWMKNNH